MLRLECYEISTNIANNTSVVRMDAWLDFTATGSTYTPSYITMNINGVSNNMPAPGYISGSNGSSVLIYGGYDVTVGHNADGSYTTGFSAYHPTNYFGDASASGSLGLYDFNFTAGAPSSVTATFTAGVGINVTWGASTSYKTPVTYYISYASSSNGGSTFGSWSSEVTTTNLSYLYSSLTAGLTYKFRVRAYNGYDQYSGYTETAAPVFLASGGKRYTTSNTWVQNTTDKRWTGSAWVNKTINRRYTGTAWVDEA